MRRISLQLYLIGLTSLTTISCQQAEKRNSKFWLGIEMDLSQLREETNTYHMFDSTGQKIGAMIFGWSLQDDLLVVRDTSLFDDGSVYETAEFGIGIEDYRMNYVSMEMEIGGSKLDLDYSMNSKGVVGTRTVSRDTMKQSINIDSLYEYDVIREEIYALLHTIQLNRDTVRLKAFLSSSISLEEAEIFADGIEDVKVPSGEYSCDVLWLKASGFMPTNKIWISREGQRRMVKFYVPGPELSIELVDTKSSSF